MKLAIAPLAVLTFSFCLAQATAQEKAATSATTPNKLKVLYITGGGYHKYDILTPLLVDGIKKHANVEIDVKWIKDKAPEDFVILRDPKLGEGYDAIIYNICHAGSPPNNSKLPAGSDQELIENALRVTREGKPTVMVHCSMHTFMASDEWTECCGERTRHHDPYRAFATTKPNPDHPAIKHFPDDWKTPGDELYVTLNFPESSVALLNAKSPPDRSGAVKESVVCWTHKYGKGPVFGTTLGHDLKTCEQDAYHRLLADGLLWACDKLDSEGNAKPGYAAAK